jgi:hypothetical protein
MDDEQKEQESGEGEEQEKGQCPVRNGLVLISLLIPTGRTNTTE